MDDGSRTSYDYDQDGSQGWSSVQSRFGAWGHEDYATMFLDDCSRNAFDYDQDGSQGWSRVESRFDASGHQDYSTRFFDDGSRLFVDFDYYGLNNNRLLGYNAAGQLTYQGEQIHGVVVTAGGRWNPAYAEGLDVRSVHPGGSGPAPAASPFPSQLPDYDSTPPWELEVEVRVPEHWG